MIDLIPAFKSVTSMGAIVVGFFWPLGLNLIVNARWEKWLKSVVAFLAAAVIGTVTAFLTGSYEGLGIPSAILLTFVVSIAAYENFWRNLQLVNRGTAQVKETEDAPGPVG